MHVSQTEDKIKVGLTLNMEISLVDGDGIQFMILKSKNEYWVEIASISQ